MMRQHSARLRGNQASLAFRKSLLRRSSSQPNLNCREDSDDDGGEDNAAEQTLAYWRLETEIRLAKDTLLIKEEEVNQARAQERALAEEMQDLAGTLFEEAHAMVQIEKEAREKDRTHLEETQSNASVLQEELKALKAIVAHLQENHGARGSSGCGRAADAGEPDVPYSEVARNVNPVLFNEFMMWHRGPSLEADKSEFMKRIVAEDVTPCMAFNSATAAMTRNVLSVIIDNMLVIEAVSNSVTGMTSADEICELSRTKRPCTFRLKEAGGAKNKLIDGHLKICADTRNRVISVCNFYTYIRYITQGLVKASMPDVYNKIIGLRLDMNKARLGIEID